MAMLDVKCSLPNLVFRWLPLIVYTVSYLQLSGKRKIGARDVSITGMNTCEVGAKSRVGHDSLA
jgi:hypothetical protein